MTAARTYLDWNAAAPLRPEARAAMLAAMDAAGNPSSVHAEGRAARAIIEGARGQVARLVGCAPGEVIFTSGATEAAALAAVQFAGVAAAGIEHDCVHALTTEALAVDGTGRVLPPQSLAQGTLVAVQAANSETGLRQPLAAWDGVAPLLTDATQAAGKVAFRFADSPASFALISTHKFGGPKGVGALIARDGIELRPLLPGGGQELRRRSGTENVVGIAGFGAAAEAALREFEDGTWERVARVGNILESALADAAPDLHVIGSDTQRLPNTSCFAVRGWKGETQVMQMDLAGFAVSAGSACASGKVGPSRALLAMGLDEELAASAIRVSIGPTTTEAEVRAFAETWGQHYRRRRARAA
ncbi:MAG TPA: aminotransferase class V-fold PLP-dependent enzyme [Thermohalobaculum sp.]|nr:aminotransferase class V-fold PLP-dependent enzyme [Thermohalobaculum sp.]